MEPDIYDILLDEYGLSPQQIEELLELGVLAGESDILEDQLEEAQGYEEVATPQGRYAGRVYQASHPLEHVGTALTRLGGAYGKHKTRQSQRQLLEDQMARRAQMLRTMSTRQPMAPTVSGPPPLIARPRY